MNLANSMSGFVLLLVVLFLLTNLVIHVSSESPQFYYDWTVSISQLAPLGVDKQVITINNQFPGPLLNATTSDVLNVNIYNNLTEPFLMTWNGIRLRQNSWQDGVQGTNCPIMPGQNWTYTFLVKDQIGSFFYFPSLLFQKAAGGYGPIRLNNHDVVPIPFPKPDYQYDILIGDWYNANHQDLRNDLDNGYLLPPPDGILINGFGPNKAIFNFQPGAVYMLRISNVGLRTSINFRIQEHPMLLVETEGSYSLKQYYDDLDIHVGQSYSVLVTAMNQTNNISFYMVAAAHFIPERLLGIGIITYSTFEGKPIDPHNIIPGPRQYDYRYSREQAQSIRMDLAVGAARPNPQGSFRYGTINITRTLILRSNLDFIEGKPRCTINGMSFVTPDTPLKLADYFNISGIFEHGIFPTTSSTNFVPRMGVSFIDVDYREFVHLVFQNHRLYIETWHSDGHSFFVIGMGSGTWDGTKMASYNMVDGIYRSTIQVYPLSWTAVLIKLDNYGMWNLRAQDAERWYLGQELYLRVKWPGDNDPTQVSPRDELPIPDNVIKCGRAASL